MTRNKVVEVKDLGLKDYKETWDYQELLFQKTVDLKKTQEFMYIGKEIVKI